MESRLSQVLQGRQDNYLFPFLWMRGEDERVLCEEIERIHAAGIRAFCVEARPHPDFVGPRWWRDMDVVLREARKREMKVWILDDCAFPTGAANGRMKDAPERLRKRHLVMKDFDVFGPLKQASFYVGKHLGGNDRLVAVVLAARKAESLPAGSGDLDIVGQTGGSLSVSGPVDVTSSVHDGVLRFDIPPGPWRIFIIKECLQAGAEYNDHINHLMADSVRVLIDAVYEAHYQRYEKDFGTTIAGFFSDEPGFYNYEHYFASIGRTPMALPTCPGFLERLSERMGEPCGRYLPGLWYDIGRGTSEIRLRYMELVTRLYEENFSNQIGDWCRAHKVLYTGHGIEDSNAHGRLGTGSGHFFRGMWGQDLAGIDVVLLQILPGMDYDMMNRTGLGEGEFFHYGLGKLGSSLARLDPKKRGRAVCEIYGAYGWAEGLKMMKWLTDHMLVRGINHFVPHAFSAKFPDEDGQPHLYARGNNPQYRYLHLLMNYANRLCHLLNGGRSGAQAAILYHAEAEWCGEYMYMQKPAKVLMQNQIDFDFVPMDLVCGGKAKGDRLVIGETEYAALLVPYAQRLPAALLRAVATAAEGGFPVFFIDGLPEDCSDCRSEEETARLLDALAASGCKDIPLSMAAEELRRLGIAEVETDSPAPWLRYFHYQGGGDCFLFFNEHPFEAVNVRVSLPHSGPLCEYDAFENKLYAIGGGGAVHLALSPCESKLLVGGGSFDALPGRRPLPAREMTLDCEYRLSVSRALDYPVFTAVGNITELTDLSAPGMLPEFSGTFRYEAGFYWDGNGEDARLVIDQAYEIAEVWLNGEALGVRFFPPYLFDIGGALKNGENRLAIEVTNTLVRQEPDEYSAYWQVEPSGIVGSVKILY